MYRRITIAAVTAITALTITACEGTSEESAGIGDFDAQLLCEKQIRAESHDPNNVEFSGGNGTSATATENGWRVVGTVDNPNGLGGFSHHGYTCSVEAADEDGKFRIRTTVSAAK